MRKNVYLPDELAETVAEQLPGLNVSEVLQDALRARLGCRHEVVGCLRCGEAVDVARAKTEHADAFLRDVRIALEELLFAGGTVEGAARVVHHVGARWSLPAAGLPQPRLPRSRRNHAADPNQRKTA